MYTTQMLVGSDKQGGSDSVILLDLSTSGVYLELKSRSVDGVYNYKSSRSYKSIGNRRSPITKYVNGIGLLGWEAEDSFGLVSQADQVMVPTDIFIVKKEGLASNPSVNGIIGFGPKGSNTSSYVENLFD